MTAIDILAQAQYVGVKIEIGAPGNLKITGNSATIEQLTPEILAHKPALLALLTQAANDTADRHRLWLVTLPTGDRISVSRTPPATVAEIQADYPGAVVEPDVEPPPAHPLEGETLDIAHALLRHWGEDDPVMIQEWLDGLAQDPDKLRQMRDEAERLGITRSAHCAEDRIVCLNCAALDRSGQCLAARRQQLPGFAPWYEPNIRQRHRCIGFQPKPDDPDQRPGRERWPNLYLRLEGTT